MTFDSNRAWQDAVAAVKNNRDVLLALGGVFFLLPTLLSTVFLSDLQTRILEGMGKPEVLDRIMQENMGTILGFGLGGSLVQLVGYVAVMALLSDRGRPTVGQAIARGLRGIPTLFAVGVLFFLATLIGSFLVTAVLGGVFAAIGQPVLGALLAVVALLVLAFYVAVKLSLVMPVVVNEQVTNPVGAMVRSWRLTRGNSLRLFSFYLMLGIGYMVIAMVGMFLVVGPLLLVLGQGQGALIAMGLVSGAIGAVASVMLTAVVVQIHRHLVGDTPAGIAGTFE